MKRVLMGGSLTTLGMVLALIMLEFALRITYPQPRIMESHSELGTSNRPKLDVKHTSKGYERVVRVTTNSLGLRDRELSTKKPFGLLRGLALGDSMTFGIGVEQEEAWPHQLESQLNVNRQPITYEVINAGAAGYGTGQQLLLYRLLESSIQPDFVVLGFFVTNDILNNLCVEESSLRKISSVPCFVFEGDRMALRPPRQRQTLETHSWDFLLYRSHIVQFFINQAKHATVWNPRFIQILRDVGIPVRSYLPGTVASWYDPRFSNAGWLLTQKILLDLRAATRVRGIPLVILIIPSSLQVEPEKQKLLSFLTRDEPAVQEFLRDPTKPQRLFLRFCIDARLECVDVLTALMEAQARGERPYYLIDQHWTPIGHRISATLVAQHLREIHFTKRLDREEQISRH